MRPIPLLLALAVLASGVGLAQSLAALAPADPVVALSLRPAAIPDGDLKRELAALDWEGAGDTLSFLGDLLPFDELHAGFAEHCLEADALESPHALRPGDDLLVVVSASPFRPVPALTALLRPADVDAVAALQDALVACLSDGRPLSQGDDRLHVLGLGGDDRLVTARVNDVFVVGTDPDAVRGVVRRAQGGEERSLGDTALGRARAGLGEGGLGLALDAAAIGELLQANAWVATDAAERDVLERVVRSLRTIGGVAVRFGLEPEGLVTESVLAFDREGGDPALARLLACDGCRLSPPFLAPADATRVRSDAFPLRATLAYVQGWLDTLAPLAGRRIELDASRVGWLGEVAHTVQLPASPTLGTVLNGAPTAMFVPVSDEDAARAGIRELGRAIAPLAAELFAGIEGAGGPGLPVGSAVAVREGAYRDVPFTRVQVGLTTDLGVTVIGSHLVIATPAAALEPLVDVSLGAPGIVGTRRWQELSGAAPEGAVSLVLSDDGALLGNAAAVLRAAAQPLAGLAQMSLVATIAETGTSSALGGGGLVDLGDVVATPLAAGRERGMLMGSDLAPDGGVSRFYELRLEAPPGSRVTVELTSDAFDTWLDLIDADTGRVLASDDDSPDTSRSELQFVLEPDRNYLVEATSFGGDETGSFELRVTLQPGASVPEPPTFADLLEAAELPAAALEILADRLGVRHGYTVTEDGRVVTRSVLPIAW